MGYFKGELEDRFADSIRQDWKKDGKGRIIEKQFRKDTPRTDNAYLNQLQLTQDIFNGLLPELINNLEK